MRLLSSSFGRALGTVVCGALVAGCATRIATNRPDQALVLFDVTIPSLDSDRVVKDQSVVIQNGKITAIGRFDAVTTPPGALVVDAKGKTLLPALADMHVHLNRVEDLPLYIAHGVTLVRNMWGAPIHLEWKKQIADGALFGPSIVTTGPILDGATPAHDGSYVVTNAVEAEAAIALHRQLGYDYVKVYSKLDPAAFAAIVEAAQKAGLPVVGHMPRSVALDEKTATAFRSIEHLTGIGAALGGDVIDEKKIAPLVALLKQAGVYLCPTRTLMSAWAMSPAQMAKAKSAPEMALLPPADLATWGDGVTDAGKRAKAEIGLRLNDRLIRELYAAGVPLLVGTDVGNPLIAPGAGVHRELAYMVRAGMSPRDAIRAAIENATRFVNQTDSRGKVAVGYRAELVLFDQSPLADIGNVAKIGGVVTRGRYYDRGALEEMKQRAAANHAEPDPFGGRAAAKPSDNTKWSGKFRVRWGGTLFGGERVTVGTNERGEQVIASEIYDLHSGEWNTMVLAAGDDYHGAQLVLGADGAEGRGQSESKRDGAELRNKGTLQSGAAIDNSIALGEGVYLTGRQFIASLILYRNRLQLLPIGQALDVEQVAVSATSTLAHVTTKLRFTRLPDVQRERGGKTVTILRYEIRGAGTKSELQLDSEGWPVRYAMTMFDRPLVFDRME